MEQNKKRICIADYKNGIQRLERGYINRKQERKAKREQRKKAHSK